MVFLSGPRQVEDDLAKTVLKSEEVDFLMAMRKSLVLR